MTAIGIKTHRFASKIWVLGGLLLLFDSFFQLALPYVWVVLLV